MAACPLQCRIVSMGQMADGPQLERAFAGATVHDLFNLLTVGILFPLEVITGYLYYLTKAMLPDSVSEGDDWEGPIKMLVSPVANKIIKANKDVIKDIALGKIESCDAYYPVQCLDGVEDYKHCASKCDKDEGEVQGVDCGRVGSITCDKDVGCPAFFQDGATKKDDDVAGGVCLFLSLLLLIVCLIGLVNVLQRGLNGASIRVCAYNNIFITYLSYFVISNRHVNTCDLQSHKRQWSCSDGHWCWYHCPRPVLFYHYLRLDSIGWCWLHSARANGVCVCVCVP